MHANETHSIDDSRGYEVRDTKVRAIVFFMIGLTLFLVITQFALWALLKGLGGGVSEGHVSLSMPPMADDEYHKLRKHEEDVLESSAWIDKTAGKVRIPIDRAIELLSERGLPSTGSGKTGAEMNSHSGKPVTAESKGSVNK